ncbi:uncharacterized protein LOC103851594 [Brassica rapa]|uniref:BnaA02g07210D protein n=3 Tax=Brassica TaxID=3705 RepID=A0A078H5D5_BRANA|nr:uncharacterized protein LOC103851594 [Brassica rapa]XP_013682491.1 uncharacterized protein BNAA02G07210D [Brassica napus]KAH0937407.1 hypothetical protein HID58_004868 [Brassica napus]CAF2137038.1 unnamed protein product [Brassica napus]CDY32659.1 BnaA02g07210D [Brassica napus]
MEGKGRVGSSSSSSFTAEVFGFKDPSPPSSSSGIFSSIFPHPSKDVARDGPSFKHGPQAQRRESSTTQGDRVEPCHLSSSLYYGGQDVYSRSTTNQTYPSVKNERLRSGEGDANGQNSQDVSRGNWWQGSLYY